MKIKAKVTLGVLFLFALMLALGGLAIFSLNSLSKDSRNILVANYESLEYTKRIIENTDSLRIDSASAIAAIEYNLQKQELNLTEPDERKITSQLRSAFERIKNLGLTEGDIVQLRTLSLEIQDLNMQAIIRKNGISRRTAENATTYLMVIGSICAIAAFTFIVNFPGYVANPFVQLTRSIKSIANKNYEERLDFDRKDEFQELAEAFNQMASKLDEYEHSNLAKVLFEKKRIETIINRMTDPVIGVDESARIIFANDQASELLHLDRSRMVGQYAPDVALHNDLLRSLISDSQTGKNPIIKAVIQGKENFFSKEAVSVAIQPTGEKEQVDIGTVILLKNITPYKELDQAKTNFIATISHELKTPIASLQMCVKLLRDPRVGSVNAEQDNVIQTLHDEVIRLSKLVSELLDLSQVETGNIKLNIQRVNPADVITRALEAVKFQADRKHIAINHTLPSAGLTIQADADKTTWILVNLLTNAIRYSPENGHVVVTCAFENGAVQFSVTDEGPGIDNIYLSRIFEKFFQVPGTPSGTGLGLAISREFIEAQGGEIHVESTVGKGSVFSFTLPATQTGNVV